MRKLAAVLVLSLVAFAAVAKERAVAPPKQEGDDKLTIAGASVTGEVTGVSGSLISLAGGLVPIDASNAKIVGARKDATLADIKPGMLVTATVTEPVTVSTAPLVATLVAIMRSADVSIVGTVQNVDTAGSQFLMLNRTIKVTPSTSFENFGTTATLASLQPKMLVAVEANVSGSALAASRVTLLAPIPPRPQRASGVVKSISSGSWVITVENRDLTFVVNAGTKIFGAPKVGSKVDVVYMVDTANANVALSILEITDAPKAVTFTGTIKAVEGSRWIITREDGKDVVIKWPESVRISPAVSVGDRVRVVALENEDGTFTLLSIVKI